MTNLTSIKKQSALSSQGFGFESSLDSILNPKSIAVVGASNNPHKIGGRPLYYSKKFGFDGDLWPVNPRSETVQGVAAFGTVGALPSAPDLAVVALPLQSVLAELTALAELGTKNAVVFTSGFAEVGAEGVKLQAQISEISRDFGMRIVGPNTQGVANFANGAIASFATTFTSVAPKDGSIAVVSQSGAMSVVPYAVLRERGVGVRYSCATGNEADLSISDFLGAVTEDPDIRVALVYFEDLRDPDKFEAAAMKARDRGIPIVALKAGRTDAGSAAASSHTGAMAVPDRLIDGFLQSCRVYRAGSIREMVGLAEIHESQPRVMDFRGRKLSSRRNIAIMSNSGASCVMAADLSEDAGLAVASLPEATAKELKSVMPSFGHAANPVDLTGALLSDNTLLPRALEAVENSDTFDYVFTTIPNSGYGYDIKGFSETFAKFAERTGIPVISAMPQNDAREIFSAAGIPSFTHDADAIEALAGYARHLELLSWDVPNSSDILANSEDEKSEKCYLSERESLELCSDFDLPIVNHALCQSAQEAKEAAMTIAKKVVVKACSSLLPHKSEYGLVHVGLNDPEEVMEASQSILLASEKLDVELEGLIVAEQVDSRLELMIGAVRDPKFGVQLAFGLGGKNVEALNDVQMLRYPFVREQFDQALDKLHIRPLFDGHRGDSSIDQDKFYDMVSNVGKMMTKSENLASFDLNPVLVSPDGQNFTVVDALAESYGSD